MAWRSPNTTTGGDGRLFVNLHTNSSPPEPTMAFEPQDLTHPDITAQDARSDRTHSRWSGRLTGNQASQFTGSQGFRFTYCNGFAHLELATTVDSIGPMVLEWGIGDHTETRFVSAEEANKVFAGMLAAHPRRRVHPHPTPQPTTQPAQSAAAGSYTIGRWADLNEAVTDPERRSARTHLEMQGVNMNNLLQAFGGNSTLQYGDAVRRTDDGRVTRYTPPPLGDDLLRHVPGITACPCRNCAARRAGEVGRRELDRQRELGNYQIRSEQIYRNRSAG